MTNRPSTRTQPDANAICSTQAFCLNGQAESASTPCGSPPNSVWRRCLSPPLNTLTRGQLYSGGARLCQSVACS